MLRSAGFDFLRLTVNPVIFADSSGANHAQLVSLLTHCIQRSLAAGLNLVLDIHTVAQDRFFERDFLLQPVESDGMRDVIGVQVSLARILDRFPSNRVALELWNEPNVSAARAKEWPAAQLSSYKAVRAAAPQLTLVLTGVGGGRDALMQLTTDQLPDANLYYSFHYYDPMPFTHQGIVTAGNTTNTEQFFHNVPFPLTTQQVQQSINDAVGRAKRFAPANQELTNRLVTETSQYVRYLRGALDKTGIGKAFNEVVHWARTNLIAPEQILLGEFGVMRPHVDTLARLRWIAAVRREAERCGFAWCRWSFDNPQSMGMTVDAKSKQFAPGELAALGLR